jgi:hypothetical protein
MAAAAAAPALGAEPELLAELLAGCAVCACACACASSSRLLLLLGAAFMGEGGSAAMLAKEL